MKCLCLLKLERGVCVAEIQVLHCGMAGRRFWKTGRAKRINFLFYDNTGKAGADRPFAEQNPVRGVSQRAVRFAATSRN